MGTTEGSKSKGKATEKELKRARLQRALEKAAGAWKDEDHPDLKEKGTYHWVRDLREEADQRFEDILGQSDDRLKKRFSCPTVRPP